MFGKKKSTRERVQMGATPQEDGHPLESVGRAKKERKKRKEFNIFKSRTFYGVLCILFGIGLVAVGIPVLKAQTTDIITVIKFSEAVEQGELVTASMLEEISMANYNLPNGYISDVDDAVGMYLSADVIAGDIATTARLSSTPAGDNPELGAIPSGKMALSIDLASLNQSVSSKLRSGDVIRIFSYDGDMDMAQAPLELQYIEVLSVSNADAQDVVDGLMEDNLIDTITLLVTEAQATLLVELGNTAEIQAALVIRGDAQAKATALEAQDTLLTLLTEVVPEETAPIEVENSAGEDVPEGVE